MSRIAIFRTTFILDFYPVIPGQSSVYEEKYHGNILKWYSTGKLEEAVARGYEVVVCSFRPILGPQDEWWRRLVSPGNVFLAFDLLGRFDLREASKMLLRPWQRLFERLGVPWDPAWTEAEDSDEAIKALEDKGYPIGSSFRGITTAA